LSARGGTAWSTKLSTSVGIVAACVLAVLVNVLVARHYERWDLTKGGLYTLSEPTIETLHALEEPVKVLVLLPTREPLGLSVSHLLDAYRAESSRVSVEFTDPDRHPAEFIATQQRFGVVAGKTEDGRIVTDAAIIVVRGDRHHFITAQDLIEVDDDEDLRARPKLELALTSAIRAVTAKDQPVACFTTGHGEARSDASGASGGAALKDRLTKNNFAVRVVGSVKGDAVDAASTSLDGCALLIVGGPEERVPNEDVARYEAFVEKGGSALIAVGPQPDADHERYLKLGLDDLLAVAGVSIDDDFVFELDPSMRSTRGYGETFSPRPLAHAVTAGLVKAKDKAPPVVLTIASSLQKTGAGAGAPVPLLQTSDDAFGMVDFFAWAKDTPAPAAGPKDKKGPLVVAFATELPRPTGSAATHGPRVVVIGSTSAVMSANWQSDELRGTAIFVDSAVAWLTARPALVDLPKKPSFSAELHVSDEQFGAFTRQVLIYLPLTIVLAGIAVQLRRRDGKRGAPARAPTKPASDDDEPKPGAA
jgi:hypothetical protein